MSAEISVFFLLVKVETQLMRLCDNKPYCHKIYFHRISKNHGKQDMNFIARHMTHEIVRYRPQIVLQCFIYRVFQRIKDTPHSRVAKHQT